MKEEKRNYTLLLTERQVRLLSYACDRLSRIICGQDWTYQEFMEEAWEKRCKEATGKSMDEEWDGGWHNMRAETEELCQKIKKKYWGLDSNALYGIRYDDTADILFDLHQVCRYQLWLDGDRQFHGVDSDTPMRFGSEPLASIERTDKNIAVVDGMEKLYADINDCFVELSKARKHNDAEAVDSAHHTMERIMASVQHQLIDVAIYLGRPSCRGVV